MRLRLDLVTTLILLVFIAGLAACSEPDSPNLSNSALESWLSSTTVASTTTEPPTTTTDPCDAALAESIAALDSIFDRMDQVSTAAEVRTVGEVASEVLGDAGYSMAEGCGLDRSGSALSELIVWTSGQSSQRTRNTSAFIEGFLPGLCDLGVELTAPARIACAGRQ